jgi:phage tail-like protein
MVVIAADQLDTLHNASMWRVNFDGFTAPVGFMTCSELQVTADQYRYAEGGDMIGEEFIGGFTFNDLTLERGLDHNAELGNWWNTKTIKASQGTGLVPSTYKDNGELILLNINGTEGVRWDLERAFIKEFKTAGGMDANNKTAHLVQSVTLGVKKWTGPFFLT